MESPGSDSPPSVVYRAESRLTNPVALVKATFGEIRASRSLVRRLFLRNLRMQYRRSVLGYLWVLLPPVVTTIIWIVLNQWSVVSTDSGEIAYGAYVISGTMLWQTFLDSLNMPSLQLGRSLTLLDKVPFPREALIAAGCGEVVFSAAIRLLVVFAAFLIAGYGIEPVGVPAMLVGTAVLMLAGLGVGVMLSPFALLYGDVMRAVTLGTTVLFFLTPVVIRPPTEGRLGAIVGANPLAPLISAPRDWLIIGSSGDGLLFAVVAVAALVLALASIVVFRVAMPHVVDRLSI